MKYELLNNDTIEFAGKILKRIRYSTGELGGYIESEKNLSQIDNARVYGDARVYGNALVYNNARVSKTNDYICIFPVGSRNSCITIIKDQDIIITGCFSGNKKEFLNAVKKTHGNNEYAKQYKSIIKMVYGSLK